MVVSYNDIYKRHVALESNSDSYISENCKLYCSQYNENPSVNGLEKLIIECGKTVETANKYSGVIFRAINKYSNSDDLTELVKENVVPRLTNYVNAPEIISEQISFNKLCDRIHKNHEKITSKNTSLNESFKNNLDKFILVESVCSTVDKFKLSPIGKVSVSLDEINILSETNDIELDMKQITRDVVSYFMIRDNVNPMKIKESASSPNNTLSEYVGYIREDISPIDAFKMSAAKDLETLNACIYEMISGSNTAKFTFGLSNALKLFEEIIMASEDVELINGIINDTLNNIYDVFYKEYVEKNVTDLKLAIAFVKTTIDSYNSRYKYIYINDNVTDVVKERLRAYSAKLKDIRNKFSDLDDSIYPDYNAEILGKLSEGVTVSTIYADPRKNPGYWLLPQTAKAMGIYYDDDDQEVKVDSEKVPKVKEKLLSKAETISKSIEEKIKGNSKREKILDKLVKIKNKIFKESESLFDVVDINTHRMDCTVSIYEMMDDEHITAEIMDECNNIIKDINKYELHESGLECYFVNMGCILEFRLATEIKVILDAPEIKESYNYISNIDKYLIGRLLEFTESDLQPLSIERINTLIECCDENVSIDDALELLKFAGIKKSIIECADIETLDAKSQIAVSKYNQIDNIDESTALVAWGAINDIINEAEAKKNNNTKNNSKDNNPNKIKGIDFEKAKLMLLGLKSKSKELSSKEQQICREIDSTFNHFIDSVKNCLAADNREQIIKGSVIPSFSKCIKIAIVAAGAFGIAAAFHVAFAPAVPVIIIYGALAGSKMLMKGEQQALLDELEIELTVINKQVEQAEGENNPKKLRALMKTQKELERQYQRLKLGNRISKNLKSSTTGTPNNKKD